MKRLIRKANKTMYHATTLENLKKITSEGVIKANAGDGLGPVDGADTENTYTGYVFVSEGITYGASLLKEAKNLTEPIGVIELSLPENKVEEDRDNPGNWHSFAYRGDIDRQYFTKVYILDQTSLQYLIESDIDNWEEDYNDYLNSNVVNSTIFDKINSYNGKITYDENLDCNIYQNVVIEDMFEYEGSSSSYYFGEITQDSLYLAPEEGIDYGGIYVEISLYSKKMSVMSDLHQFQLLLTNFSDLKRLLSGIEKINFMDNNEEYLIKDIFQ